MMQVERLPHDILSFKNGETGEEEGRIFYLESGTAFDIPCYIATCKGKHKAFAEIEADGDNSAIRTAMQEYDPNEPLSDMAILHRCIATSKGGLDYLWDVGMTRLSIRPRGVHEPIARAVQS